MAQLPPIPYDGDITLKSSWSCTVVYLYDSYGAFNSVNSRTKTTPNTATSAVQFTVDLPVGAKILGMKVHATHEANWPYGQFKINSVEPDDDGFVALDVADFSSGDVEVEFSWQANQDSYTDHDSTYPTYNGNSSQSKTYYHSLDAKITDVYLLIEYKMNGLIYRAASDKLVPYQIYHAENDQLVPYLLFKAVDNELIQY